MRNPRRVSAFQWGVSLLTVAVVLLPIAPVVLQAFLDKPPYKADAQLTLQNFVNLAQQAGLLGVLLNTLFVATVAMIVAQIVGTAMAVLVGRTNLPGRGWLGEIAVWPLFVSHVVIAFGWFTMYGPSGLITMAVQLGFGVAAPWDLYSLGGIAIVAGLSMSPVPYLLCLGAAANANTQLEAAARSAGATPWRVIWSVTIPMMRPAIIYSAVLNFVGGIELLAFPLLFGGPENIDTIATFLYVRGVAAPGGADYGLVGAAAVMMLAITIGIIWLQGRLLGDDARYVSIGGKATAPMVLDLGVWKWPTFAAVATFLFLTVIVIFAAVFVRSGVRFLTPLVPFWELFTTQNYEKIFELPRYARAITNSIIVSVVGGAIGTVLIVLIALISRRSDFKFARQLEYVALFPRAVPAIIAGLGFFYAVIWVPGLDMLRGTIFVLILAFIVRYIPIGFGAVAPALAQIGADLDRSARVSGANWIGVSLRIVLPLLRPAMFSCFAMLFIYFFKEYSMAAFLFQPGSEIIGSIMLDLWAQGDNGTVAAFASIQVIIIAGFVYASRKLLKVKIYG